MSMENTSLTEYSNNMTDSETADSSTTVADPSKLDSVTKTEVTMDDRLAKLVIKDQAGSLVNAWREALQNAIDKQNSTLAELRFNKRHTLIYDDGDPIDLTNTNIEKLLTCLGVSSKDVDDDNTIGNFGVGLGKVMSVGILTVMSGHLSLHFDFKLKANRHRKDPLDHELDVRRVPLEKPVDGVKVFVHHYEDEVPSYSYKWTDFEEEIKKTMGYATFRSGTDVRINDEYIDYGDPFETVSGRFKIQKETDNAYIAIQSGDGAIDVYSNGLFVKTVNKKGIEGTVVTKGNLDLDLARNDIQQGCKLWGTISTTIEDLRKDILGVVPDSQLTTELRAAMAEVMSDEEELQEEWSGRDVFKLANGDTASLEEVQQEDELGWAPHSGKGAEQLIEQGETVMNESDPANEIVRENADEVNISSETFDPEDRAKEHGIDTGFNHIENTLDLRPKERNRFLFAKLVAERLDLNRDVRWGESENVDAWTDGVSHITLTESAVDEGRFPQWSKQVYDVLMRMKAYDTDSRDSEFTPFMKREFFKYHQDDANLEKFHKLCREAEQKSFKELFQYYQIS